MYLHMFKSRKSKQTDCLLGVVTQPTDSRLRKTRMDEAARNLMSIGSFKDIRF